MRPGGWLDTNETKESKGRALYKIDFLHDLRHEIAEREVHRI